MDVFKRFNGRLAVADEHSRVVEGAWDREKLVMMSFPDETEVQRSMTAPDCVEMSKDRKAGADAVALLAKGVDA